MRKFKYFLTTFASFLCLCLSIYALYLFSFQAQVFSALMGILFYVKSTEYIPDSKSSYAEK